MAGSDDGSVQSGWLVELNEIANVAYAGIELTNVTDSDVLDNVITSRIGTCEIDLGDSGVGIEIAIRARGTDVTAGTDVLVEGNWVKGSTFDRAAINILSRAYEVGADALLEDVTVSNNETAAGVGTGILMTVESRHAVSSATIDGLPVKNNSASFSANGMVVRDCGIWDCSDTSANGTANVDALFRSNTPHHNTGDGILGRENEAVIGDDFTVNMFNNNAHDNGDDGIDNCGDGDVPENGKDRNKAKGNGDEPFDNDDCVAP